MYRALSKTPVALALNQTQHCKQLEGLVSAQVQLCRSNLELMHTVVQAAREVMKACRRAFADMRWNCSSIELAPNYLLDLERGREPTGARGWAQMDLGRKAGVFSWWEHAGTHGELMLGGDSEGWRPGGRAGKVLNEHRHSMCMNCLVTETRLESMSTQTCE